MATVQSVTTTSSEDAIAALDRLPPEERAKVIDYVKALKAIAESHD